MQVSEEPPKYYLVTGGCGFIGSHLVDALIAEGHAVIVLDDLSTGRRENLNPKAVLVVGDTTDYSTVAKAFEGVDGCFHLAAIASVEKSNREWAQTHKVNVLSTINVFLAASLRHPTVPVVYTSSAAVYGNCQVVPTSEMVQPYPLSAYGADKLACDLQGQVAWGVHNVPNIGLRPFNIYGVRQDPHSPYSGVISIFMDRIQKGQPLTIYGDGRQMRDFVYVSDAVKVFQKSMDILKRRQGIGHDVINICTGRATSINDLADTLSQLALGKSATADHVTARNGDIRISIGSPDKLSAALNLRLETTLQQGLSAMLHGSMKPEIAASSPLVGVYD